jgi:asparagine N-glycosylation enzyme membrane subunit Stt3
MPYPALRRMALSIFQWSTLGLILMGCVVLLYAESAAAKDKLSAAVMVVEEATRIIEVGLLMFLFLFSTAFGLHWRQCVFGMALGLGIFATVELIALTMRNYWGEGLNISFSVVRAVAFNISLMVWAGYLLAREKETSPVEVAHRGQLEQWNQVLTEFIYQ